jgi:hypothetical protein
MALSSPEVQKYRQRKISFNLLLETQGHLSSLQYTFYCRQQGFVSIIFALSIRLSGSGFKVPG